MAEGNGRNVIERFSLNEAFFEGILERDILSLEGGEDV
jgi:hypothetical protein